MNSSPSYNNMKKKIELLPMLLLVILTIPNISLAQKPVISGVDHIGITVPNMDSAIRFFTDVFGFEKITEIGPFKLDDNWRKTYHVHPGLNVNRIVSMRTGTGANIELFEFNGKVGKSYPVYQDEISWHHIALYTPDIRSTVALLRSNGVRFLSDIVVSAEGPTAGESWVYFLTPWGTQMELNSYPQGKGYQKDHKGSLLWSPGNYTLKNHQTIIMTNDQMLQLVSLHQQAWAERDKVKRDRLIDVAYSDDITVIDPHRTIAGKAALSDFIAEILAKEPDAGFTEAKKPEVQPGAGRWYWQFGPDSQPDKITGQDVFAFRDGKINILYVFLDVVN
ncbi:MAG: VOC family protein [Chitinophagaceae bacterium]